MDITQKLLLTGFLAALAISSSLTLDVFLGLGITCAVALGIYQGYKAGFQRMWWAYTQHIIPGSWKRFAAYTACTILVLLVAVISTRYTISVAASYEGLAFTTIVSLSYFIGYQAYWLLRTLAWKPEQLTFLEIEVHYFENSSKLPIAYQKALRGHVTSTLDYLYLPWYGNRLPREGDEIELDHAPDALYTWKVTKITHRMISGPDGMKTICIVSMETEDASDQAEPGVELNIITLLSLAEIGFQFSSRKISDRTLTEILQKSGLPSTVAAYYDQANGGT